MMVPLKGVDTWLKLWLDYDRPITQRLHSLIVVAGVQSMRPGRGPVFCFHCDENLRRWAKATYGMIAPCAALESLSGRCNS
ncbi:MAG TPA: hypothetical protein VIF34_12825, partial [Methylocystis sp.]